MFCFTVTWILNPTKTQTHAKACAAPTNMSNPLPHKIHIKFHYYTKAVLVIILLFHHLTCNVNGNCLWQQTDAQSVLLTLTMCGLYGGVTFISCKARQSVPLKNGCCLTLCSWPPVPKRCDGSFIKSWKDQGIINTFTLHSIQLCPSQLLHVSKQKIHNWNCTVLTAWHWHEFCYNIHCISYVHCITMGFS
jgi:hypothetical protein